MYPYYNPYSIYFGEPASVDTVTLALTDYEISVEQVLSALISILEDARVEGNATWRENHPDKDLSMNSMVEMRKAKLKEIAATSTDPINALTRMIDKTARLMAEKPTNVVSPKALQRFVQYTEFVQKSIEKYQQDIENLKKQPETYDQLSPEQKAEVDKLQEDLDAAAKAAKIATQKALPWYQTDTAFIVGGMVILGGGFYFLWRATR